MQTWQLITSIIITLAGVVTALKVLTKPILDKLDRLTALESRVANLESWTRKQQSDVEDNTEMTALAFEACLAILDHLIVKMDGNGKCHEAQDKMNDYIHRKMIRLSSYKTKEEK